LGDAEAPPYRPQKMEIALLTVFRHIAAGIALQMLMSCLSTCATFADVEKGDLNATDWNFIENDPLLLSGSWEVIWGELVEPIAFEQQYRGETFTLPARWNGVQADGIEGSYGTATFRMRLSLPTYNRALSFFLISPHSAWRLYQDGVYVGGNGTLAESADGFTPSYVSRLLPAQSGDSTLVLQVANFTHAYGGPGHAIQVWDAAKLRQRLDSLSLYYILVLGIVFAIGLIHFVFYFADRSHGLNGPVHLWFGLLCLVIVFRIGGIVPHFYIYAPESLIYTDLKIVYLSLFIAPAVYLQFFKTAFPEHFPRGLTQGLIGLCLLFALLVLVSRESFYTHLRDFSIFLNLAAILYTMGFTAKAALDRHPGAVAILLSNVLFLATALNDAFIYTDQGSGFDLTPFGFLLLVSGYSYALLLRLQRTFLDARATSTALEVLNRDLERQVADRTRAFKAAAARAENSALERANFIAAASHDLRQPLHALAMFTSVLKRKTKEHALTKLIDKQETSITHLSQLLQDSLDASRLESRQKSPEMTSFRLAPLLDDIRLSFEARAEKESIQLVINTENGPCTTDRSMLQRIIANLTDNAIKAARTKVNLTAKQTPIGWQIHVDDDGIGVSEEDAARIFEPYVSLRSTEPGHSDEQTERGGYGLGLYVVNEFTRMLNGQISVTKSALGGCRFQLELPNGTEPAAGKDDGTKAPFPPAPEPGLRVFAVDDELEVRQALHALLTGWDCDVQVVAGAQSARDTLANGFSPDLLIMDYQLVGTNGLDLIADLRATLGTQTPALIITGATETAILEKIDRAGIDRLQKPIDPDRLGALLRSHQNALQNTVG